MGKMGEKTGGFMQLNLTLGRGSSGRNSWVRRRRGGRKGKKKKKYQSV